MINQNKQIKIQKIHWYTSIQILWIFRHIYRELRFTLFGVTLRLAQYFYNNNIFWVSLRFIYDFTTTRHAL